MNDKSKRKVWFERNEQAERLEAEGKTKEALRLYEQNAAENCDVAYTYERMAALYRSEKLYDREVESLERALRIEEKRGPTGQMLRLKERLESSRRVREGAGERPSVRLEESTQISTRRTPIKRHEKKGCLSVVALAAASGAILASLLI